jgi:2-polyprenyl-6-methoxyphenol hydroxylase-like FAD-dependent oxidoreductase
VIDTDVQVPDAWLSIGEGNQFLAMPMTKGRVYLAGLVQLRRRADPLDADDLRLMFQHWHDPVPLLLADVHDAQLRWDRVLHRPAPPAFHRGRIVLTGDAAHPMTPDLGQGGCQAIEDGVLLATALRRGPSIAHALEKFGRIRRPRVRRVVNDSRRIGAALALTNQGATTARDQIMRLMPATAVLAQLTRNASAKSFERQLAATPT